MIYLGKDLKFENETLLFGADLTDVEVADLFSYERDPNGHVVVTEIATRKTRIILKEEFILSIENMSKINVKVGDEFVFNRYTAYDTLKYFESEDLDVYRKTRNGKEVFDFFVYLKFIEVTSHMVVEEINESEIIMRVFKTDGSSYLIQNARQPLLESEYIIPLCFVRRDFDTPKKQEETKTKKNEPTKEEIKRFFETENYLRLNKKDIGLFKGWYGKNQVVTTSGTFVYGSKKDLYLESKDAAQTGTSNVPVFNNFKDHFLHFQL
jgi:hypothetical protein